MLDLAQAGGFRLIGTHPSRWEGRGDSWRNTGKWRKTRRWSRRLLAFGLRIHIGVEDRIWPWTS